MPRWTEDQQAAIESRNANLLVSAAAGSGKTAVLVERIIRLVIEEEIPIDEMLIVTFTNAAASEMRERIISALYEVLETENNSFIRTQINNIQKANIMTLHAFCIQVARNNAHFIDIDPGFKVGDQVELSLLQSEVVDAVLEEAYESADNGYYHFVESFSENRQDHKIVELINNTYNFIQSQPEPLKWLLSAVDRMDDSDVYIELMKKNIRFDLLGARELIDDALTIANAPDGPTEYIEALEDDLQIIKNLHSDDFIDYLRNISFSKLKSVKKARKEEVDENLIEEVKSLRKSFKDLIGDIKTIFEHKTFEDYIEDLLAVQPNMYQLYKLVKAYDDLYKAEKNDQNLVDFNDLEHLALKALKHEPVRKIYQRKFQYIFLDEYQDSNLVQETIINYIKRENNLFLVGDVKQSIYKFRLADPSLFMDKYHNYSKAKSASNRRIDLKKNFRSRHEILVGINYIFENLMSESFGEISYDDDAKLYTGIEFGEIENPAVQVDIVEGNYTSDDDLKELSTAEVEALSIARSIKNMLGKQSYDRKNDRYFPIDYKHIVVLMRAVSSWAPVFNDVFMNEGIPLYSDGGAGYFDTIEIRMIIDLLKLIDNPYQDLPLLTVLRSPIFNFSTDDLMDIRNYCDEGHFYEALLKYDLEDNLHRKIDLFLDTVKLWQEKSLYETLGTLIWDILNETGFYQYVLAMPGGRNRQGNLRLLVDRADQSSFSNLYNFIQMIEKMKKTSTELGTAKIIGENENVVRIMSIHKSKGLEFPVVFVAGLGKKFNMRDTYADVLMHKNLGLGPKFIDPIHRVYFDTLPKKLIKRQIKFESLAEEMRILYVALTRAVDKLILVGTAKNIGQTAKKWCRGHGYFQLSHAQSYLDWLMSILVYHPDGKIICDLAEKPYLGKADESKWAINIIQREMFEKSQEEVSDTLAYVFKNLQEFEDIDLNETLDKSLNYVYPYELNELPSKISVTALKALENEESIHHIDSLELPNFLSEEQSKSKAEIGTLVHFVMQKLDRLDNDINQQIQDLSSKQIIKDEELKYISVEKFEKFFSADLGRRYRKSLKVEKEKPFVLKKKIKQISKEFKSEDEIYIQGIIDCYFEEEDGIVLIDYKTDYLYDEELLATRYEKQLLLYKEAIESITGKKVIESYIYSFYKDKAIRVF